MPRQRVSPRPREETEEDEERFSYLPRKLKTVPKERVFDSPERGRLRGDPHYSPTRSGFSSDGISPSSITVNSTSSVLLPNRSGGEGVIEATNGEHRTRNEETKTKEGAVATVAPSRALNSRNDKGSIITSGNGSRTGSGDIVLGSGSTILTNCTTITTLRNNTQTSVRLATEISCQTSIAEECSRPLGEGSLATPITALQSSSSSGTPSDNTSTLGKGADADGIKNAVILKDTSSFGKPSIPLFSSLPPFNSEEGLAGRFPLADSVARNHKNTTSAAHVGSEGSHHPSSSPSHSSPLTSNDGRTTSDHALAQKKEDTTLFVRSSPSTFSSPNARYPSPLAVRSKSTTEGQLTVGSGRGEEKEKLEMGSVSDDGARFVYSSPSPLRCSSTTNFHLESDAMDRESEAQTHRSGLGEPPESASAPSSLIGSPRRSLQTPLPEHRKRSPSLSKGFKSNKSRPPSCTPVDNGVEDNPLQVPHSITNADVESSPPTAAISTTSSSRQGLMERRAKFDVTSLVTLSMENLHEEDNSPGVCLTSPVASFRGWFPIRSSAGGRPLPMSTVSSTRPAFGSMHGPAGPTLSTPVGTMDPASPARGARGGAAGVRCGGTVHCPADTPNYSSGRSSSSEHTKKNMSADGSVVVSGSQASHRTLKVVSYNILAQRFVSTDDYPTCPPSALTEEHRVPLLMKELRQAAADIIALSEISVRVFAGESSLSVGHFLHHTLHYDGFHVANTTMDGTVVHQAKPYFSPSCCKKNGSSGTGNSECGVVGMENALMPHSLPLSQLLTAFGHDVPASPSHHPPTRMGQDHVSSSSDDDTDGIAIFFNHQRFEVLEAQPVYFNRIGASDPSLTPAERKAYLVKTHNVGFALALHDLWNPSWIYIVGTSHLIWRSEGQLWQLHQLLKVMEKMKRKYQQKRVTSSHSATPVAFSNGSFTSTSFHSLNSLTNAAGVDKSVSLAESSSPFSNSAGSSQYTSPLSRVRSQMTPPPTLPPLSPVTKEMVDKGPEMKKGSREEWLASQESGGGGGFVVTLVGSATRPGRSPKGSTDGVNSNPQSTMAGVPSSAVKTGESSSGGSYYSPTTPKQKTSSSASPHVTGETTANTPTMMSASMKEAEGGPARSNAFLPMTPGGGTANSYHVACILTGDFNMEPYHAALDYARTGLLRSDAEVCKAWRKGAPSLRQSLPGVPDGTPSPSLTASSTTSPTTIKVPNAFTSESTTRNSPSVSPYSAFSSRKIQPLSIASSGASASSGKLFTILPCSPFMHSASVPTNRNAHTLPPTLSSPLSALPSRAAGAAEEGPILRLQRSSSSSCRMSPSLCNTSSDMSDGKDHENSPTAVVPYPLRSPSLRTTLPSSSSSHPYVSLPLQPHSSTVYRTFGAGTSRGHTPILPSSMPTASTALEMTSDSSGHSNPKVSSTSEMSGGSVSLHSLFPMAFPPSATAPPAQLSSNVQSTLANTGVAPTLSTPSVGEQNSIASMNSRNTNSNVCSAQNSLSPSFKAIAQGSGRSFVSLTSPSSSVGNDAPPAAPTKHVRNETSRGKKVGTVKTIASHQGYRTHSREILVVESPKSSSEGRRTSLSSVGLFSSALENSSTKQDILSSVLGSVGRSTLPSDPSQTPYFPLSLNVPGCYYLPPPNGASLTPPPSHPSPESSPSPVGPPHPCPTDASNGPDDDSTPFLPHFRRSYGYIRPISGRALRAAPGKRENNKRRGSKKDGALTMLDTSWTSPLNACLSEGSTEGLYRPFAMSARTTNVNFSKSETSFIFQRCKSLTKSCRQTKPRGIVSFSPPPPPALAENVPFPTSSSVVPPPPSELTIFTPTSPPVKGPEGKKRHSFDRTAMIAPVLSGTGTPNTSPSRERRRSNSSSSSSNEANLQGEEPRSTTYRLSADKVKNMEDKRKEDLSFPTESSSEDLEDSTQRSGVEDLLCTARHTPSSDLGGTRMVEGPPSPLDGTSGIPSDENGLNWTARTLLPLSPPVPHPLRVLPVSSVASRLDGLSLLSGPRASFEVTGSLSSSDSGNSTKKNLLQHSLSGTCGSHSREMNEDKESEEEESAAACPLPLSSPCTASGTGGKSGTDPFPPLIALEGGSKGRKDGGGGRKGEQQWGTMTVVSSASSRSAVPTLPYFSLSTSSSTSPCRKVHEGGHGSRNSSTSGSAAAPDPEREVTLPDLSKDEKGRIQNPSTSSFNKSAGGFSAAFSGTTPPLLPPYPTPPLPPSTASLPFRPNERGRMLCVSNTPSASNDTQADVTHDTHEEEDVHAMQMDCASPRPRRKKHTTLQQFATSSSWMEEEERGSRESGGEVEPFAESSSYMMLQDPGSPAPRRKRAQPVSPSTPPEGSRVNTGGHALLALGSGNGVAGVSLGAKGGTLGERNAFASPSQPSSTSWGGGLSSPSLLNASGTHTPLSAEPRCHPSNPPHPLPSSLSLSSSPSVTNGALSSTRLYSSGEYSTDPPPTISSSPSTPHQVTAYATPCDRKPKGESGDKEKEERLSVSNRLGGGGGNKSGRVEISLNLHGRAIPKPMGEMMASATAGTAPNVPCSSSSSSSGGGGAKGNNLPDGGSSSVFLCSPPHPVASHQLRFHNVYETYFSKFPNHVTSSSGVNEGKVIDYILCDSVDLLVPVSVVQLGEKTTSFPSWNCPSDHFMVGSIFSLQSPVAGAASSPSSFSKTSASSSPF